MSNRWKEINKNVGQWNQVEGGEGKTNIGTISGKDDGYLESGGGRRSKGKAKGEGTQESDGQIYADEESDGIMNLGNNHINI